MTELGFGLMRLPLMDPEDPTSVDIPQLEAMVDAFLASGFDYFDTAYLLSLIHISEPTRP